MSRFLPAITPSRSDFTIRTAGQAQISRFTGIETVVDLPGDRWIVTLNWRFMTKAEVREMRGFLMSLRGPRETCFITDTAHQNASGSFPGLPVTNGISQYGTVLNVRGLTASTIGVVQPGDRFTINNRLHEITESTDSDSLGNATLRFFPEIINPVADGMQLITNQPYSRFFLERNQMPSFSQNKVVAKDIRVQFMEALRAV